MFLISLRNPRGEKKKKTKGTFEAVAARLKNKSFISGNHSPLANGEKLKYLRGNLYNTTGSRKSARNILSCTDLNQIFDHPCVLTESANPETYGQENRSSLEPLTSFDTYLIHCKMTDPFGNSNFVSSGIKFIWSL